MLDFFAGSGTTAAVAQQLHRRFVMVDHNAEAIATMRRQLDEQNVEFLDASGDRLSGEP